MPELIQHIDAIGRQERRAVLYLAFHPEQRTALFGYRYTDDPVRSSILAWLDEQGIGWCPCLEYANENIMASWRGQVYLAVPYDDALPAYQILRDFLEHADGTGRHAGVRFMVISLATAARNAMHDEPGYLENIWGQVFQP